MRALKLIMTCSVLSAVFALPAFSQEASVAGGESGYDKNLAAMEPVHESIRVGLAGDDPADIGRYLLAANGGARNARLSPNARSVAFRWSITGAPQLWVMPVEGGLPRQLTYGNGITFFRWTPDGQRLLYGADDEGNEQEAYFSVRVDGTDEQRVLAAASGGFRRFGDFVVDDQTITYASTERNRLDFDIYVTHLGNGEIRIVHEGTFGFFAHRVSPTGRHLVVSETVGEDSDNLYLLDLNSGKLDTLSAPARRANHTRGGIAWTADGSGFFLASNAGRDFSALMLYELKSGFELVEEAKGDISNVTLFGKNDRYLAWTVNEGGYSRLYGLDRKTDATLDIPKLPEGVYSLHGGQIAPRLAITINGWRTPGSIAVWDLPTQKVHLTFRAGLAGLDPERLVRPESLSFSGRDGVELHGLLYLPDATSRPNQKTPPVVFLVHGGPTSQSRPTFNPTIQYHVDRGVAVFAPNVRGSTGFGHTYVTLDDREKRLDSVRDLVDMLAYLKQDGRVDTTRAAVVGGSYGGYMVNSVLANFPGHFVAGVSLFGVADWVTALQIASPSLKASDRIEYGDIREQRWQDYYHANSPIRQANQIDVPVLYSHGIKDPRIDISETEAMVKTLRSNGIDAPFIRIPDEGHGWRKLSNQLFYYRRQAEFLEEKLGINSQKE